MNLYEYVAKNTIRGACQCGRCCDAPDNPKDNQPSGHTADLTFFKVSKSEDAKAEEFKAMVEKEFPHWLDSKEHSYLEVGADIGDQGVALMAMGLGKLLDVWNLLSPATMMPFLPDDLKMKMAGQGMVSIKA